ncbi:hypothetical protein GLYMA_12G222100v4 [Glycine max]|nr:hypothetical protein GLYMA_12G222100v4 [Glycine max]KAH1144396.1 hypothetical protein GYH30_034569 [Glycine max]
MSKALGATTEEDEEDDQQHPQQDCFYDSHDRLLSLSSSCSCSNSNSDNENDTQDHQNDTSLPNFTNYDIWISQPSSVSERRTRLLLSLGLSSLTRSNPRDRASPLRSVSDTTANPNKPPNPKPPPPPPPPPIEELCTIRDLDNGKEFVVNELENLREVATGRQLTMEEFEMTVGHSPIVQELMRRQNVEEASVDSNAGGSKVKKKGTGWLKSIKSVASSVAGYRDRRSSDERDTSSEKGGRRSSSATDDSQEGGGAFHGPERVRVKQYGKSCKEVTALYKSQEIQAHSGSIWSIKFSLDGKYLASAGEDCVIHVWQVVEGERKGELLLLDREKGEDGNGNVDMFLVVNGSPMADGERKRKGRSSVSRKSLSLDQFVVPQTVFALTDKPVCSFQGHLHDVLDLSWSKTQHLLSSSMDKTVRLWHLSSKSCLKIFSHSDYVTCIQFNPVDDRYFISGSLDAKVRIWSIPDRQVVDWTDLHEMVTAACYTPDGQGALVGSYKGSCHLYNTSENKLQQKSQINLQNKKKKSHHKKITGFQFAPGSSSEVLITSADSRIRVVDGVDLVHKFKGM